MQDSFPPPGFVSGPSQVPGIDVYIPAPAQEKRPDLIDFKCPKCGATTAYSVEVGKLACEYCGYNETLDKQRVGRNAEEFEFTVETIQRSQKGWGENRREMACRRCGGVISVPMDALAYSCPFCASNKVLFREPLEDVLRPRFLIPFTIGPTACRAITQKWLGGSWMTPSELKNFAPEKFAPLFIPYWTFDARANATWKAMVGYEKVEHYTDPKGEQQERRTIEWRSETGKVNQDFNDLLVPGTQRLNLAALGRIDTFNLQDLIVYEPRYLAGMNAQAYDLPLEKAWEAGRYILRERTRQTCLDRIPSTHVRSFSMALDFSDEQWRYILAPLYTSVYLYGDHPYQILINGQSGKIAGQRPVSWQKVWLVIAALLSPGIILGLASLLAGGAGSADQIAPGEIAGAVGLFLLAVGMVISFFIIRQAQEMEHV
ncbi:MAG: hypothetical protein IH586_12715 [Anaerolineaceae bacterium]|nr:hypothetical protein [Anaerolineaceae bacterium]